MSERSAERRGNYADVETLLIRGFLSQTLNVFGRSLTIRSLFPDEMTDAVRCSFGKGQLAYKRWIVAHSIYALDGFVFHSNTPFVFSQVERFPKRLFARLFSEIVGLTSRYHKAMEITQAFSYETYGRQYWQTYRGIPTNPFGLVNGIQTVWQFVNVIEDDFQNSEMHWNHAKFIASAMSPKGVKKQNGKDETRKRKMKSDREEYIEKALRYQLTNDDSDKPLLISAKTDEQLMEEYHRWVRGEKDEHDLIVQNYKDRIRQGMADRQAEREAKIKALMGDAERGIFSSTRVADGEFDRTGFTNVRTLGQEGSQNRLYKRFVGREETGGQFYVDETGNVRKK